MEIIKRYKNRKLYVPRNRSWIAFADVWKGVLRGDSFKVVDFRTKNDLTAEVLTRMIFENAIKCHHYASVSTLNEIIRQGGLAPFLLSKGLE